MKKRLFVKGDIVKKKNANIHYEILDFFETKAKVSGMIRTIYKATVRPCIEGARYTTSLKISDLELVKGVDE